MFKLNLIIALRNLWKHKGFSLINIGGLAIGLASCLMLLLYINYEWSYDKQFKNIDRIYGVCKNISADSLKITGTRGTFSNSLPAVLSETAAQTLPGIAHVSRIQFGYKLVSYRQNSFNLGAAFVDPGFLQIFDYKYLKGSPASALSDPGSVLLTATTAKKLFGRTDPIGKVIKWDNREGLKVTAVIEDLPGNQTIQFDVLLNWALFIKENTQFRDAQWDWGFTNTIVQLKNNQSFPAADALMRKMIRSHANDPNNYLSAFLFPYAKNHLYTDFKNGKPVGGKIDQIKLFLFLAFGVLLIACINYMNLSTAQSERRAREVGVRKALGSTRNSIAAQFLTESLLISFLAMILAFALLELFLPYFNHLLYIHMVIDYDSALTWAVLAGLIVISGLLAGSYPSLYLSSFTPVKVLKGALTIGKSSLTVRKALVVLQFTFSVCMIICAILVYSQIQYVRNKPLGFSKDNLIQIEKTGEFTNPVKTELFRQELLKAGVITAATEYSAGLTNGGENSADITWPGHDQHWLYSWNNRVAGYDFTQTLGLKILEGRDFSRNFSSDTSSVLLNEAAVKSMELQKPLGKQFKKSGKLFTIIGVLQDYNYESAAYRTAPTITYLSNHTHEADRTILLRLNPKHNLSSAIQTINEWNRRLNPAYPSELIFIDQEMEDKLANEKLLSSLSNLFGGFAIFISCLGLLGLALYMAEQRSKEISIRKVLGADLSNILFLLNKDFLILVVLSNLIACPLAYIISYQWLQQFDYSIELTIWPMLTTTGLSLLIAIFTVSIQSFKIAKANPIDALKYE